MVKDEYGAHRQLKTAGSGGGENPNSANTVVDRDKMA